ncbi:MAG TPA: hypothetical protein VE397_18665 [Stellaceae bacterium]|nr:hypothetical protein [Stellaceae bacterium]
MKRAPSALVLASFALTVNVLLVIPARADCTAEISRMREQVAAMKDAHRRREVRMLLDKAEKDDAAGRPELCREAMQRARTLVKDDSQG